MYPRLGGNEGRVADEEKQLIEDAKKSREETQDLRERSDAEFVVMRGKPMPGWLRVEAESLRARRELAKWVEVGTAYARSLPAKG